MDDDVLSQGSDREPRPWPRRLAVTAALVAVVAGGLVYLALARHNPASVAAHRPSATASPAPTASASVSLPAEQDGIAGETLSWRPDVRLPTAAARPAWFSPASGGSQSIGGLPANRSGYQFTRVTGGWAVQPSPARPSECADCAGPPTPVWFLADGARSVTSLGIASLVAPSASAGAVWLTSYAPGDDPATAAGTAREVSVVGGSARPIRLPSGYDIEQGTARGLLLAPASRLSGMAAELWDPATARVGRSFGNVLAASPGEIAWTSRCAPSCGVQLLNLATGGHTVVTLPAGHSAASGAFSPDGKFLALQVSFGGGGGGLAVRLEVLATAGGGLTAVPGTWVSSDALVSFGWPAARDSLVAEFNFTTKTQLASWQPGARHAAVTAVRLGRDPAALTLR